MKKRYFIIYAFLFFLPSSIKIICYRALGAKIGKKCYIGFSLLFAEKIDIGDFVRIGHFNLIKVKTLKMTDGSMIDMSNWITGAVTGSFYLGRNSVLTFKHYLDASANITIGNNTVIAGRSSVFFSHGINSDIKSRIDIRPIIIGDWCYIGSNVNFVPGSGVADHTFVGMGSVVSKQFTENYILVAGNSAEIKKHLSSKAEFFDRAYLPSKHHPPTYQG